MAPTFDARIKGYRTKPMTLSGAVEVADDGEVSAAGSLALKTDMLTARTADAGAKLVLLEGTDNGSNMVILGAPASLSGDRTITVPDADVDLGGIASNAASRVGKDLAFPKTSAGATTVLAANAVARAVIIRVEVTTTFDAGDGAAPSFDIGETDTPDKFDSGLNDGTAGDGFIFSGTLSANKALLVTATAATGTGEGAIKVTVIAAPLEA